MSEMKTPEAMTCCEACRQEVETPCRPPRASGHLWTITQDVGPSAHNPAEG